MKDTKEINIKGFCAYCEENKWEVWNKKSASWECRKCYPIELEKLSLEREKRYKTSI